MKIEQKRFLDRYTFDFHQEHLEYSLKDRNGSRSMSVGYLDFNLGSRSEMHERNEYFRNVGFFWMLFAIFSLLTGSLSLMGLWGTLGAICLCIYYFGGTKFIMVPTSQGYVFIVADDQGSVVLDEIVRRYKEKAIQEYGEIDFKRSFEEEKTKYRLLLRQGVLDEVRFNEILAEMEQRLKEFANR